MNICMSSQRTHLCRCRDSFGRSPAQFHHLLFFSSRCFKQEQNSNDFPNSRSKATWFPLPSWRVCFLLANNGTKGEATANNPCSTGPLFPSITLSLYMGYIILTMRPLMLCHFEQKTALTLCWYVFTNTYIRKLTHVKEEGKRGFSTGKISYHKQMAEKTPEERNSTTKLLNEWSFQWDIQKTYAIHRK